MEKESGFHATSRSIVDEYVSHLSMSCLVITFRSNKNQQESKYSTAQLTHILLIFNTTNTPTGRADAIIYAGATAVKAQVANVVAFHRTAPVVTVATCDVECTSPVKAVTRRNKLQRRAKSTCGIVAGP